MLVRTALHLNTSHFKQSKMMCGPASLKIVAGYFGTEVSEKKLAMSLRAGLGENHAYAFNRPAVFPRHLAKRLDGQADVIQCYVWSWNRETLSEIENGGTACHMVQWFISREKYLAAMCLSRWRGLFFSVYDLTDAAELSAVVNRGRPGGTYLSQT